MIALYCGRDHPPNLRLGRSLPPWGYDRPLEERASCRSLSSVLTRSLSAVTADKAEEWQRPGELRGDLQPPSRQQPNHPAAERAARTGRARAPRYFRLAACAPRGAMGVGARRHRRAWNPFSIGRLPDPRLRHDASRLGCPAGGEKIADRRGRRLAVARTGGTRWLCLPVPNGAPRLSISASGGAHAVGWNPRVCSISRVRLETEPVRGQFTAVHLAPHVFGFLLFFICSFMPYGSDFKGAWIFVLIPREVDT